MRKMLISGAAALLLAGCTPMYWVKGDTNAAQAEHDWVDCQREAWSEARYRAWLFRPLAPTIVHDHFGRRYFAWPHSAFYDPFGDQFMEESRLANFCMRSKGYELVPAETIQPSQGDKPAGKP